MGYSTLSVPFIDLNVSGEVKECSVNFGHLLGRCATIDQITNYKRASFEIRDDNGDIIVRLDNGDFAVLDGDSLKQ